MKVGPGIMHCVDTYIQADTTAHPKLPVAKEWSLDVTRKVETQPVLHTHGY
jgi:hypothetical protein